MDTCRLITVRPAAPAWKSWELGEFATPRATKGFKNSWNMIYDSWFAQHGPSLRKADSQRHSCATARMKRQGTDPVQRGRAVLLKEIRQLFLHGFGIIEFLHPRFHVALPLDSIFVRHAPGVTWMRWLWGKNWTQRSSPESGWASWI